MDFPIYRKYKGLDVWFQINSPSEFIEIKQMGRRLLYTEIQAKIFPEKQFIQDMIDCYEDRWEAIEASDFSAVKSQISSTD